MATASAKEVFQAYLAYFGRPPDVDGLNYWMKNEVSTMHNGFGGSAEYAQMYSGMDNSQRVDQVYKNLLGRNPDAEGKAYWVDGLSKGLLTIQNLVLAVQAGAQGLDQTTLENKLVYAIKFTAAMDTPAEIIAYNGAADNVAARAALATVTSTSTSLEKALSTLDADVAFVGNGVAPADGAAAAATAAASAAAAAAAAADAFTLTEASNAVTLTGSSTDAFAYTINGAATRAGGAVTASSGSLTNSVTSINTSGYSGASSITLAAGGNNVTGGAAVDTVVVGTLNSSGTLALAAGANVVTIGTGGTLSGTISATAGTAALTIASGGSVTMKAAHYTLFNTTGITAAGTEQITLSDALTGAATLNSNVETFVLANAVNSVTLGTAAQNVTGDAGVDTIAVGTLNSSGTLALAGGANVVTIGTGGTLSGTISATAGTATLTIASGGSVTMKAAHYSLFNTTGITAAGTEQITLSDALTSGASLNSNVETFVLANATNTGVATASSTTAQSINAGSGSAIISLTQTTAVLTTITNFTTGGTDVIRLNGGTGAVTGQAVAGISDTASRIVVDTSGSLGASGVSIGDQSAYTNKINYAVASDTGAIYYDADGNWTAGSVQIGTVGTAVVAGDFKI